MSTKNLELVKVFTEIRFSPSLLFSDLTILNNFINNIADQEEVSYDENNKKIELRNYEQRYLITFFPNRIVVDMDQSEYSLFKEIAEKAVSEYSNTFQVKKFQRAGIRFNWGYRLSNIKHAKEIFINNFFNTLGDMSDLGNIINGKIDLRCEKDDKKYNLGINTVRIQDIKIKGSQSISSQLDYLVFDVDVYEEKNVSLNNFLDLLRVADTFSYDKASKFISKMDVGNNEYTN